jgi:2-hydroxychromene-2-carboxylate isomerase
MSQSLQQVTCYIDFISPYAYLAFEHLPKALEGTSYAMVYKPVLFAGMLKHHGQLGPAEIPDKKAWTFRQVQWLAHVHGLELKLPARHPFNPLALLRLALACGDAGACNRFVAETIFRHVWCSGQDATDDARLQALTQTLAPRRSPQDPDVKAQLVRNTEEAIACGVFGVPSWWVADKLFWGLDALPMLKAWLQNDAWYETPAWQMAQHLEAAVQRKA